MRDLILIDRVMGTTQCLYVSVERRTFCPEESSFSKLLVDIIFSAPYHKAVIQFQNIKPQLTRDINRFSNKHVVDHMLSVWYWHFHTLVFCALFGPATSNPRPSWRFCAASSCFRCSKSIPHTDNLSLFWWSSIWHFCCRWSSVSLYHICYHCS